MPYAVSLTKSAAKELEALPQSVRARVREAIGELAVEPRPVGCRKLEADRANGYRIRIGDYRAKYTVDDARC